MKNLVNNWILKTAPFLAPFPTAYVIYGSLVETLQWDPWVAFIAAAVIEMIGFRSVGLLVEIYQFNRTCSAVELRMRAPLWQPILTVVVYFLAVVSLTILLEIVPTLAMWSPVGFTVMGLTGGWLAALTSDQDEREKSRADLRKKAQEAQELARKAKQEKKQGKQLAQASPGLAGKTDKQDQQLAQVAPASPDKLHPQVARKADKLQAQDSKQPVQDEALLAYWRDNPQASDQQVADKFGKSRQAIQQRRDKLIDKGEIKMTPQGVEIIGIAVGVAEVTA
jgi:hypothetical protein